MIQDGDELAMQLRRPAAPNLPCLLLLLLLSCLLLRLGLEAKRRGSWRHGGRPRHCLRKPHHLAPALLAGALGRRRRQQGQIRHPDARSLVVRSQAERRERRRAGAHSSLERQDSAGGGAAGLGLRRTPPLVLLLRSQNSKLLGHRRTRHPPDPLPGEHSSRCTSDRIVPYL